MCYFHFPQDVDAVIKRLQTQIGLVHSKVPLKEFDHSNCKTEGWAEQVREVKPVLL